MRTRSALRLLICSLALSLSGCSGCGSGTPPLAAVSGTVAFQGQPVPTGLVVFTPDPAKGSSGPIACGKIQPDGSFILLTGTAPGAVAGWHRITLVALTDPEPSASSKYSVPISLIPDRYRSPDLSGLSREVRMGEKNEIKLNLD